MPIHIIRGMVNISEHTAYWKNGAVEDLDVAEQLVRSGKARHGLFFAHLAIEKMLKAHICKTTRQIAPKIHNLVRLAECADLKLEDSRRDLLAEMNEFNLEGRYPTSSPPISPSTANEYMDRIKEVFQWLTLQL